MKKPTWIILFFLLSQSIYAQTIMTLFPGDTNNDGICNHYDLLPIGLKYDQLFEPREPASLDWLPQSFLSWSDSLPVSLVNTGFADADGNGVVDAFDLDAFPLNYDSVQTEAVPMPASWLGKLTDTLPSSTLPILRLSFNKTVVQAQDTLIAILSYALPPNHPTQALGLALWLTFPPENIINNEVRIEADTVGNNLMYVSAISNEVNIWRNPPAGNIQFAAAGKGQNDIAGEDTLAQFYFIIEDKIIAANEPFALECKEGLLINADEQVLPFEFIKDSVMLEMGVPIQEVGIELIDQTRIAPHPVRDHFTVECPSNIKAISWLNLLGQELFFQKLIPQKTLNLNTPAPLPAGNYLLKIFSEDGTFLKKVVKL